MVRVIIKKEKKIYLKNTQVMWSEVNEKKAFDMLNKLEPDNFVNIVSGQ